MKLHEQRDEMLIQIAEAESELQWMREHLASSKFTGPEFGSDMINVRDVDAFILRVREALNKPHKV